MSLQILKSPGGSSHKIYHFQRVAWTDAYLGAFAQAAGSGDCNLRQGLARFPNLKRTILSV